MLENQVREVMSILTGLFLDESPSSVFYSFPSLESVDEQIESLAEIDGKTPMEETLMAKVLYSSIRQLNNNGYSIVAVKRTDTGVDACYISTDNINIPEK